MTQGFDVLCGPTVLPSIGPVKVSEVAAVAAPAQANVIANVAAAGSSTSLRSFILNPLAGCLAITGSLIRRRLAGQLLKYASSHSGWNDVPEALLAPPRDEAQQAEAHEHHGVGLGLGNGGNSL